MLREEDREPLREMKKAETKVADFLEYHGWPVRGSGPVRGSRLGELGEGGMQSQVRPVGS